MNLQSKLEYDLFVRGTSQYSVFMESWWLDSVTNSSWEYVSIRNSEGRLKVAMPLYIHKNRVSISKISLPPCTQYQGIAIINSKGKYATKLSDEMSYLEEIADKIPYVDIFQINLSPENTNLLPFDWRGFVKSYAYTYVINDLNPDNVFADMKESIRTEIRKAEKKLFFKSGLSCAVFWDLYKKNYLRQKMPPPYSFAVFERIYKRAISEKLGEIFYAEDSLGNIHSAIFVVWDSHTAYYIAGSSSNNYRNSGANSFVIYCCIKLFHAKLDKFDFCGSSVKGIERFFRHFGAKQVLIPKLSRQSFLGGVFLKLSLAYRFLKNHKYGT